MNTDIFIIPEAPMVPRRSAPSSIRKPRLAGSALRLGVLDNSKANADNLLRLLVDELRGALPLGYEVMSLRKTNAAAAAHPNLLDQLAAGADFIVGAMAD